MSEIILGTAAVIPRGPYDPEAVYKRANVVTWRGLPYMALQPSQGAAPDNELYWMRLMEVQGLRILGRYDTLGDLEAAHAAGEPGDAYAVGAPADNAVHVWDDLQGAWVSIGPIQGPQGERGERGATGDQVVLLAQSAYEALLADGTWEADRVYFPIPDEHWGGG